MNYIYVFLFVLLSYLIGSIPIGLIVGKISKGIDIRDYGSKNIGTTNAVRVLGVKLGLLVFLGDFLKGTIVIWTLQILQRTTSFDMIDINNLNISVFYGLGAIIGHMFPLFAGFKGGKAVATGVGVIFAINPLCGFLALLTFGLILLLTGYSSLSSILAAISALLFLVFNIMITEANESEAWFRNSLSLAFTSLMVLLIIIRHKANIMRLIKRTEKRFNIGLGKHFNNKKEKVIIKKDGVVTTFIPKNNSIT